MISAPSEQTLDKWLGELEASVHATTRPEALRNKEDAVTKLKPLLMAQLCSEVRPQQPHLATRLHTAPPPLWTLFPTGGRLRSHCSYTPLLEKNLSSNTSPPTPLLSILSFKTSSPLLQTSGGPLRNARLALLWRRAPAGGGST